jgi:hypothetical protein
MRIRPVFPLGRVAIITTLAALSATLANTQENHKSTASTKEWRLVLSPQARLQVPVQSIGDDSVEAIVTVSVPDSCKTQRHRCRLEASHAVRLATIPSFKWALRWDTLMVLSSVPLQIRAARQSFTGKLSGEPLTLRIHYENLDHVVKTTGVAVLDLVLPGTPTLTKNIAVDTTAPSRSSDSTQAAHAPASGVDLTQISSSLFGIILGASVGLILLLLLVGKWLHTRSQRRRFQRVPAKSTVMPFSRPQMSRPVAATVAKDTADYKDEIKSKATTPIENAPLATPEAPDSLSSSNLPVAISGNGSEVSLATILTQLHELNLSLQQVIATQNEANRRLEQMGSGIGFWISRTPMRISLFDIINDEPADKNADPATNEIASTSKLRIQFASDNDADKVSVNLASSAPVHIQLAGVEETKLRGDE